ncbi:unnamed protein product [Soboliphyme baturini]|uniref:Peptidase_M1_N domain-containing protein n=1 Tax=Soboliphyme baturini TaxID=241478 RepID=A0A183J9A0_9BILA|nr:unnamed protein product [Soboliphyme baturini]
MEMMRHERSSCKLSYCAVSMVAFFFVWSLLAVGLGVHYGELNAPANTREPVTPKPRTLSHPVSDWILPENVVPISYNLKIQTYLPSSVLLHPKELEFAFHGDVTIYMECRNSTSKIIMNLKGLDVVKESLKLSTEDGQLLEFDIPPFQLQPELERIIFSLKSELVTDQRYVLNVSYSAPLSDSLGGYYRSKYTENGITK